MTDALTASWTELGPILPELVLAATATLLLLLDVVVRRKTVVALGAVAGTLVAACLSCRLLWLAEPVTLFDGMFVCDGFAGFFKLVFYLNLIFTICFSPEYLSLERAHFGEYYPLLLLSTTGMMIMASSGDLIVLFLGLELMTLSSYVLVGIRRHRTVSNEAAIKYFLLGGFSTGLLLYGIALLYGLAGSTSLEAVTAAVTGEAGRGALVAVPVVLLVVGFGYKIGSAPFHMWAPDVYEGAPTTVTSFLSVGAKAAAFAATGRVLVGSLSQLELEWSLLLMMLSVLSMAIGSTVALAQTNVKRMLAYSSIAHAGYALLGVVAGGRAGVASMATYLFVFGVMNIGAFAVVILLRSREDEGEELSDFEGLARTHPLPALFMLVFMFSLVGIPPTAGFVGKFHVLLEVTRAGYAPLAALAVVFSVVSAFFYLRIVMLMYMRPAHREVTLTASLPTGLVLVSTALAVVLIGVYPGPLLELVEASMGSW